MMQYSAMPYNSLQCNAIQCDVIQYDMMQCNVMQYIIWHNTIQFSLGNFFLVAAHKCLYKTNWIKKLKNLHIINIIHQYNTMHYDYFLHPMWWHLHRAVGVIGTLHLNSALDHCIESVVHLHPWVRSDTWEQHLMFIITQLSVMCLKALFL